MGRLTQFARDQLREQLEEYIETHHLSANSALPSERMLCEMFSANRVTLREAIKEMKNEGVLYSVHGKGNFIASPKYVEDVKNFISYTAGWETDGHQVRSKVIDLKIIEAPKKVALALDIRIGSPVYLLQRVRYLNDIPLFLETAHLPADSCPGLENFDFSKCSLYKILENFYHIKLCQQEHTISITHLSSQEAHLLNTQENAAAFFSKQVTTDTNKTPMEYCISIIRADKYKMKGCLVSPYFSE